MTPLHLKLLLHYYSIAEPYSMRDHAHAIAPATLEYTADLVSHGLIEVNDSAASGYQCTDRGKVFIDALLATPLPVQKWVML